LILIPKLPKSTHFDAVFALSFAFINTFTRTLWFEKSGRFDSSNFYHFEAGFPGDS